VSRGALALLGILTLAACSASAEGPAGSASGGSGGVVLQVFAAASLTDAFGEIEADFEDANPGVDVQLTLAGSSDLAAQIAEGAPADVFAPASEQQLDAVRDAVPEPHVFASNILTIAVPADNPAHVTSVGDVTAAGVNLVICAPSVPCGAATQELASARGLALHPVSEESNVTDVLGKVASGEADAGIVYATDISRADNVMSVELAGADAVVTRYPIGTVAGSPHPDVADAFVAWVMSDAGQAVLESHGFLAP
jgi:molybdate transport system substrate-binding protein